MPTHSMERPRRQKSPSAPPRRRRWRPQRAPAGIRSNPPQSSAATTTTTTPVMTTMPRVPRTTTPRTTVPRRTMPRTTTTWLALTNAMLAERWRGRRVAARLAAPLHVSSPCATLLAIVRDAQQPSWRRRWQLGLDRRRRPLTSVRLGGQVSRFSDPQTSSGGRCALTSAAQPSAPDQSCEQRDLHRCAGGWSPNTRWRSSGALAPQPPCRRRC